jgi:methylamine dehydrogenase heavy chain
VWVIDGIGDFSESRLFDSASGQMLGMLSTGYWSGGLVLPSHGRELYAMQSHFTRSTRGERTDIVAIYDPKTLLPTGEIEIPPRRMTALTLKGLSSLTADNRFLIIQNFTPAQSASVVDLLNHRFVTEVNTPGCTGVYARSAEGFASLCGNGSLFWVDLGPSGEVLEKGYLEPFFDPHTDPVSTDAVRLDNHWLFASHEGYIYPVNMMDKVPSPAPRWNFLTDQERKDGWRFGGFNHMAIHAPSRRLFMLMQDGGEDSYEEPASEIWVFDIDTRARLSRFELAHMTMGIEVSNEAEPHIITSAIAFPIPDWSVALLALFGYEKSLTEIAVFSLDIYTASDGKLQRTISGVSSAPTLLQIW